MDLKARTKQFTLSFIGLVDEMPISISTKVIANQLVKSGTSVGANYRAACRSRSDKEFISKINIVLEEADECCFWLELIQEKNWLAIEKVAPCLKEANELTAIFVSTLKSMNNKINNKHMP